jgi:REP element-mobilizing transposase RayT
VPRKPRADFAGAFHHVYVRGNDRRPIFVDDVDRLTYLRLLAHAAGMHAWRTLAFCLMPNHVHLLIETPKAGLSSGMCRLQGHYARRFNKRHGRSGHLFQGRFGAKLVEDDAQLWMTVGYIARNPVEARLCDRAADWPWASDPEAADGPAAHFADHRRLLSLLGAVRGGDPLAAYRDCVEPR